MTGRGAVRREGGEVARSAYANTNKAARGSVAITRWYICQEPTCVRLRKSFQIVLTVSDGLFDSVSNQSNPTAEACFGIVDAPVHRL